MPSTGVQTWPQALAPVSFGTLLKGSKGEPPRLSFSGRGLWQGSLCWVKFLPLWETCFRESLSCDSSPNPAFCYSLVWPFCPFAVSFPQYPPPQKSRYLPLTQSWFIPLFSLIVKWDTFVLMICIWCPGPIFLHEIIIWRGQDSLHAQMYWSLWSLPRAEGGRVLSRAAYFDSCTEWHQGRSRAFCSRSLSQFVGSSVPP